MADDLERARARRIARDASLDHHPSTQSPGTTGGCPCGATHLGLVAPPGTTATTTCRTCAASVDVST